MRIIVGVGCGTGRLESTGDVIVAAEEWEETAGRKKKGNTRAHTLVHAHFLTYRHGRRVYNMYSIQTCARDHPFDDIDGVCRLLLRARLSQTIRLSCVSDSLCTPQSLKIPGVKELRHFAPLVHRTTILN